MKLSQARLRILPCVVTAMALQMAAVGQGLANNDLTLKSGDGKFSIRPSVYLTFRYEDRNQDDSSNQEGFRFRAARLGLGGHIYQESITYRSEIDFATAKYSSVSDASANSQKWNVVPKDVFINYMHSEAINVRVGQFKVPFSVQEVVSDKKLQFVDRSIATSEFGHGRDNGIMFHGDIKKIAYALGAFNGEGENSQNNNAKYLYAATVSYVPMGAYKSDETDLDMSEDVALKIALEQMIHNSHPQSVDSSALFVGVKKSGFSSVAEYYLRKDESDITSNGYYAQLGYFILPEFETALRWSSLEPDTDTDNDGSTETAISLNYYFLKHNLKGQLTYAQTHFENNTNGPLTIITAQALMYF